MLIFKRRHTVYRALVGVGDQSQWKLSALRVGSPLPCWV